MPAIDVVDSTWVGATPRAVAAAVADESNWRRWWPGLELAVAQNRGADGIRWQVRSVAADVPRARIDGLTGTAEVWLQPVHDGVVAHFFLRLDPPDGVVLPDRQRERISRHHRALAKSAFFALGDSLDAERAKRMSASTRTPAPDGGWQISW